MFLSGQDPLYMVYWLVQCFGFVQQGLLVYALVAQPYFGTKSEENNALCAEDYLFYMLILEYHVNLMVLDDTFGQNFFTKLC